MFAGQNIIVLDLEVLNSPDDIPSGWANKSALGLSIGAYYDYADDCVHWFDEANLADTMLTLVQRGPLMVSFNGKSFDFALMRGVLRNKADTRIDAPPLAGNKEIMTPQEETHALCDTFKKLAADSYDILAEIWRSDSAGKFKRGLNSLDAILAANDLGTKSGDGASAPKWWKARHRARVMNYCQDDVFLTKALFEYITIHEGHIQRSNGPLAIDYMQTYLGELERCTATQRTEERD